MRGRRAGAGLVLAGMGLISAGCIQDDRDEDLKPPRGFAPPPLRSLHNGPRGARLDFAEGFFPVEWGTNGMSWRWMGARGEIRLPNDHRSHLLRISGWFPLEFLAALPTIRLTLEDQTLDTFVPRDRTLRREYPIPKERLGAGPFIRLVLETSATASVPNDTRSLGISIDEVEWR